MMLLISFQEAIKTPQNRTCAAAVLLTVFLSYNNNY